jgi:thymidylate synthase
MKQYLELLSSIKKHGALKPAARAGMPSTQSLFGYQFRHNLSDGFPILTTKKMFFKGVVIELLWFLRGDTNIKYLVDNGVNIWNEDAYNYYIKKSKELGVNTEGPLSFDNFVSKIKEGDLEWGVLHAKDKTYKLGDCGYQYGKVWRSWTTEFDVMEQDGSNRRPMTHDQIAGVLSSLQKNPESRRHIVTAIDPGHESDLALYWCHAMFQFNCRPLTGEEQGEYQVKHQLYSDEDIKKIPKYYLDCQLYQRSADSFLGVPFNIASYALLTHIFAKICNMIPGDFIHTFGDVHIYSNHEDAVKEQLSREPMSLPKLIETRNIDWETIGKTYDFSSLNYSDFALDGYKSHPAIKAELSTGLIK